MSAETLQPLKRKRTSIKASCTRIKTYVDSLNNLTPEIIANLIERKEKLSLHWSDYNDVQSEIEIISEEEGNDRIMFEEAFFNLIAKLRTIISDATNGPALPAFPGPSPSTVENDSTSHVRLPKLNLPSFSGRYEDWFPFHDTFNSVINNNPSLNNIKKFQYLKSSVSGDAADVIQSLELSNENYIVAWELLKQRYDNKRAIVQAHLRAIFEMPNITKENASELRHIADGAAKHIRALRALGRPTDSWDDIIIHLLTSKLDAITTREWQVSLKDTSLPTLKEFLEFLNHRCQVLEATGKINNLSITNNTQSRLYNKKQTSHVASVSSPCHYCKGEHLIYYCREFLKLSPAQRLVEVRKRKLCINCLHVAKHSTSNCKSRACKTCGNKHNTLLHLSPSESVITKERDVISNEPSSSSAEKTTVVTHTSTSRNQCILLSTAIVHAFDRSQNKHKCRVLLDSGSQANFITRSFLKRLNLKSRETHIIISGINGTTTNANQTVELKLQSRVNEFSITINCILTDRITERIPATSMSQRDVHVPHSIKLADPEFYRSRDIDILIGAELFWQLICIGQINSSPNQPTFQKTLLGWIIAGRLSNVNNNTRSSKVSAFHASVTNLELRDQVAKFWQLEEIPRPVNTYSLSEKVCENHFINNVSRDPRGRIIVKLPIKEDKLKSLGETRAIASRRFFNLEKRLTRDPILKLQYASFIREYIALDHMKLVNVDEDKDKTPTFYLPHHCVLKPTSTTTKLRVVFDGSCKSTTGVSLNDALMIGPTVQQDLISIILRFRMFKFVFTADVVKMYRQVLVDPAQTRLQRILWRDDASRDLQTYELCTVTYGTSSASFLATRSIRYLAELYSTEYPIGAQHIIRDFYVDDLLSGADTLQAAIQARDEIVTILNRGSFQLSKWSSNEPKILNQSQTDKSTEVILDKNSDSRILGILWNPSMDIFRFSIERGLSNNQVTKRTILSEISSLFDPLGLIGPVIISSKLIMQEIWQLKTNWDETVPSHIHTKWISFKSQLPELNNIIIPRCVKFFSNDNSIQLHGFCDASQQAYGACIYIRTKARNGDIRIELLISKTRVAPLKAISLPRLELCAALLLAQLYDKVRSSAELSKFRTIFWSDSTITLSWISSCSRKWSIFIANRVGEIQRLTNPLHWRHIPSEHNPADLLSRGINLPDLIKSSLWWHGPSFLQNDESQWPINKSLLSDIELPELKRVVTTVVTVTNPFLELLDKISNLNKICRIVSYCLRFTNSCRKSTNKPVDVFISHEEMSNALDILCKIVQEGAFDSEIKALRNGKPLNSTSRIISLSPFLDDKGLLRVGGRLKNSQLTYSACHPILLPKSHRLTYLIISSEHIRNLHAGLQGTIAAVRQNFWPLSIRSIARKITKGCIICFKCRPSSSEAQMGVLPAPRVTPSRPFAVCGVDYAGPLSLREGKRRNARNHKAYICIFVCFATKAVHIELVGDLTSDSFLASLKRFISRRGKPISIYSDNGTAFTGASRLLSEFYDFLNTEQLQGKIKNLLRDSKITWNFIPPNAPHFGGLWEAAVRSTKTHLYRIIGNAHLTFEEMHTVLCEIESILNSRPITPLSTDPNDLNYITPGHFLVGDALNSFPCRDVKDIVQNRLLRWERVEQLRQHFWSRWSLEYLNQLQQRQKWQINKGSQLEPGQVVLIKQPGLAPLQWIIGRVLDLHKGDDGVARSATIKTARGSIVRPLSRLAILPLEADASVSTHSS